MWWAIVWRALLYTNVLGKPSSVLRAEYKLTPPGEPQILYLSVLPSFLQRVGIYYSPAKSDSHSRQASPLINSPEEASNRKSRCLACNPQKIKPIKVCMDKLHNMYLRKMLWASCVAHIERKKHKILVKYPQETLDINRIVKKKKLKKL